LKNHLQDFKGDVLSKRFDAGGSGKASRGDESC
jgi:hypothetical protein